MFHVKHTEYQYNIGATPMIRISVQTEIQLKGGHIMTELALQKIELPVFSNRYLNTATQKIMKKGELIGKTYNEVALILAEVSHKEAYKDDGFKSAAEYAMKTFGFKKSFAYSLIKIGENFMTPELTSTLPHKDIDFTVSQLDVLLPLQKSDPELLHSLAESGEINPTMTKEEIKQVVKQYSPKKETKVPEEVTSEEMEVPEDIATEIIDHEMHAQTAREAIFKMAELVPDNEQIQITAAKLCKSISDFESAVALNRVMKNESEEN